MRYNTISNGIFDKPPVSKFFTLMPFKCNITDIKCIIGSEIIRCGNPYIIFELHRCNGDISVNTYTSIVLFTGLRI